MTKSVVLGRRRLLQGVAAIGLSGAAGAIFAGCASPTSKGRVPRIGVLSQASSASVLDPFRDGLRELGYVDGETIAVVYRFPRGLDRQVVTENLTPQYASELAGMNLDLIVAGGSTSALAAKNATSTIPILGVILDADPVASGLVTSLARPGGNLTGITNNAVGASAKRLELLSLAIPSIRRVAGMGVGPSTNRANLEWWRETQDAAKVLGIDLEFVQTTGADDLERAFDEARAKGNALLTAGDATLFTNFAKVAALSLQKRLPTLFVERQYVDAGGLMNYGPSLAETWRRAASYVDRILKGAKPADLPVEEPHKFDFVINLKAAATLSLTIPQSVLGQATEVLR